MLQVRQGNVRGNSGVAILLRLGGNFHAKKWQLWMRIRSVVRCDQHRALDLGSRGEKKLERVSDEIVDEVLARLAPIFE